MDKNYIDKSTYEKVTTFPNLTNYNKFDLFSNLLVDKENSLFLGDQIRLSIFNKQKRNKQSLKYFQKIP